MGRDEGGAATEDGRGTPDSMLSIAWHDNVRDQHDIMPNGFCMWHDGGMTGSMTVRLS